MALDCISIGVVWYPGIIMQHQDGWAVVVVFLLLVPATHIQDYTILIWSIECELRRHS